MPGKIDHVLDLEGDARDIGVQELERLIVIQTLIEEVGLGLIDDRRTVLRVFGERERIGFDVGEDAFALFAQAFCHQLLDPKAQTTTALRREERELVASLHIVFVKEGCQHECGVVHAVATAQHLGTCCATHERIEVDACKRSRQETEHGKRRLHWARP